MVIIDERDVMREEPTPHGKIGTCTAFRIADQVPNRSMEFRKRILHPGAEIGLHLIEHDEVYYVLDGEGEVFADGKSSPLKAGQAAYLYTGDNVGIRQVGTADLTMIVSYPLASKA
ncbi:cupin domain-containing protein [Paracoccus aestuariivivens]|uniref:Cupin domain-containing protein n=1 Tax=Paracoccus aestuariivivens TaxID=1820333 RepID=A0A6L6J422_9RHOB|nr:cupin domain-containing protein [Paracoccus aestuariivivens]MTH76863.1 cupin domain-containing protein [Paracoccus aestuariivivens]